MNEARLMAPGMAQLSSLGSSLYSCKREKAVELNASSGDLSIILNFCDKKCGVISRWGWTVLRHLNSNFTLQIRFVSFASPHSVVCCFKSLTMMVDLKILGDSSSADTKIMENYFFFPLSGYQIAGLWMLQHNKNTAGWTPSWPISEGVA